MYSEYLLIGEVLKPQGVNGQVKVRPDTDDPARFRQLETVYLKQGERYAPCSIEKAETRADGFVYCVLNGASSRDEAEKQRGWMLYVDRAHAVDLEEGRYFISDLLVCHGLGHPDNITIQAKILAAAVSALPVIHFAKTFAPSRISCLHLAEAICIYGDYNNSFVRCLYNKSSVFHSLYYVFSPLFIIVLPSRGILNLQKKPRVFECIPISHFRTFLFKISTIVFNYGTNIS